MNIVTLDFETDDYGGYRHKLNPYNPRTRIVTGQFKYNEEETRVYSYFKQPLMKDEWPEGLVLDNVDYMVGHNIKYDLALIWQHKQLQDWLKAGGQLFDTMVIQHFLNGFDTTTKKLKLDFVSEEYGFPIKDDYVAESLKAGKKVSELDEERVIAYGKQDVDNTYGIFKKQIKHIKTRHPKSFYELVKLFSQRIVALVCMEYNGLLVDKEILQTKIAEYEVLLATQQKALEKVFKQKLGDDVDTNILSTKQLVAVLYGGTVSVDVFEHKLKDGKPCYFSNKAQKAGQPILIRSTKEKYIQGFGYHCETYTDKGAQATTKTALQDLYIKHSNEFITQYLDYKKNSKLYSTYYKGFESCIAWDKRIHTQYSNCSVVTTRLSSRAPNFQNMPGIFRNVFKTSKKYMVAFDYNQLETRILANETRDPILLKELETNKDLHRENAAVVFRKDPKDVEDKERKVAKGVSFGLAYGAGAKTIALNMKIPLSLSMHAVKCWYDKYQKVVITTTEWTKEVEKNTKLVDGYLKSYYTNPYGKMYSFVEVIGENRKHYNISPTVIKNYRIQGTAADILVIAEVMVMRWLFDHPHLYNKHIKLVNQVHDELDFEFSEEGVRYIPEIKAIMENVPMYMKQLLNYDFTVKLIVEAKIGPNLGDLVEYKI